MLRLQQNLPISGHSEAAAPGLHSAASRRGFTLVEMMVAVVILAVGLLGLASTAAVVIRQVGGGAHQSIAATVVQSRLEWLRSMPCSSIKDSSANTRGVAEHWVPTATVNRVLWVVDTVTYPLGGSTRTQAYTMTVPC
jgi:prepilin-type N-terminal cleavage/methylation domain-containing protein